MNTLSKCLLSVDVRLRGVDRITFFFTFHLYRFLSNNKIVALPEKVFHGLTSLKQL